MRSPSRCPEPPSRGGFSLVEVLIVLLVLAVLAAGLAIPLAAQLQLRRFDEARRQLDEAAEAILGFAAAHGRLPCPATAASRGEESFAAGGDAANGACATYHAGFLPAATLGLAGLDGEGFARDPWGGPGNRIRYAVFGGAVHGVASAFTRANGLQAAGLPAIGAAPHLLYICTSGRDAHAGGCGPAASQLTRRAAFVLVAAGANAAEPPRPGSDEARNLDGDAVFVARAFSAAAGAEYDDLVHWVAAPLLVSRLLAAGRLP